MSDSSRLDRLSNSRVRSPRLAFRSPSSRSSNEYQLQQLDPKPESSGLLRDHYNHDYGPGSPSKDKSSDAWGRSEPSPASSPASSRRRAMFNGPPPPIAASVATNHGSSSAGRSQGIVAASTAQLGSLLFNPPRQQARTRPDSAWRAFSRREKAIEQEIQQLLDLQATGLVAGSGRLHDNEDGYSDTGSSTPTGTLYSTAASKSGMANSLYVPTRSSKDGNVIPVRQPVGRKPPGLRSARAGLRRAIAALVDLKQEEDAHIDAALSERKKALVHLSRLSVKRNGISNELETLEEDEEEPLGKELRGLQSKHDSLTQQIRELEEKLMAMRNQRNFIRDKMEDVQNRRDAGLSGYRGALKDIDNEIQSMMRHPPIQPLDAEIFPMTSSLDEESEHLGGMEFLSLIPERRTSAMAKSWWEGEVRILSGRREQINKEKQALEEGGAAWREVTNLVAGFESSLRRLLQTGGRQGPASAKGKEPMSPSPESRVKDHLAAMNDVVARLEECLTHAEAEGWNLLICAVGAELEAFREAQDMLGGLFIAGDVPMSPERGERSSSRNRDDAEWRRKENGEEDRDEGWDRAAPELRASVSGAAVGSGEGEAQAVLTKSSPELHRRDSENDVPPEFLAELDKRESI